VGIVFFGGCSGEGGRPVAKDGNEVKVHYTGTLEDGTVFDSSEGREPLSFTLGSGNLIPGFEDAVRDMEPGEKKTVTIPSEDAYGAPRQDLMLVIERDRIPENIDPEPGQQLQMQDSTGKSTVVRVAEVTDEAVTLDANHPLAGKDLTFEIEVVEIK
jgi:peptidylprolyl isomerase